MGKWDELQSTVSRLLNRVAYGKRVSDPAAAGAGDVVRSKPDEYFSDPHRRERIGRVLTNLGKFAVDSAVDESLKSVTVCKVVKEGPNEHQYSRGIKKQDLMVAMEEMQAKMEKMQEDVNQLKLQNADYAVDLEPFDKFPDEPKETSPASPKSSPKKVFIRSRL